MKPKDLAISALLASIICVLAPLSAPIGPVPISLATFAIYLVASVADWKHGITAVIVYILIGAFGVPVFSGFSGGFQKLFGVTGGYIWGYIPLAASVGLAVSRFEGRFWAYPAGMVLGTLFLYTFGTAWFMFSTGNSLSISLAYCVVPFLIGDAIKIALASVASYRVRHALSKRLQV